MSDVWRSILAWLPTAAILPATLFLFSNPRELGVEEARSAAAKPAARAAFWYFLAAVLVESGRFVHFSPAGVPAWLCLALPAAGIAGSAAFWLGRLRTNPGILETASDEVVRRWRRRFFAGKGLVVFAAFVCAWAAVRFLVL
jgi:hypothetical protein